MNIIRMQIPVKGKIWSETPEIIMTGLNWTQCAAIARYKATELNSVVRLSEGRASAKATDLNGHYISPDFHCKHLIKIDNAIVNLETREVTLLFDEKEVDRFVEYPVSAEDELSILINECHRILNYHK